MQPSLFCLLLAHLPLFASSASSKIPSYMKFCKRSDPNLEKCLIPAAKEAIAVMSEKGEPRFGILPLDPFRFSVFEMNQGSGPVSINLTFTDLDYYGLKDVNIETLRISWDPLELELVYSADKAVYLGDYKISGKILVLPVFGSGRGNITMEGIKVNLLMSGKSFTNKGKTYVEAEDCKFTVQQLDRVYLDFKNLFNGDKTLGDQMNKFVNENWKVVTEELQGPMLNGICQGVKQVANRIFHKIPLETLAPL